MGHGRIEGNPIMIVGDYPGPIEEDKALPMQGQSGRLLNDTLRDLKVFKNETYITYAVKCRPLQEPGKDEQKACFKYLEQEIAHVRPKVIVTLGNFALQAVLGKSGIMNYRGQVFEKHGAVVIPTVNPSAVLRTPRLAGLLKTDLRAAINIKRFGRTQTKAVEKEFICVNDKGTLKSCLKALNEAKIISYDIETETKDPHRAKHIWCIGMSDMENRAWVVPLEHPESNFKKCHMKVLRYIEQALKGKTLIAQNGKYDNVVLRRRGIKLKLSWDTMLASHSLDENTPNNLEYMAADLLREPSWKKEIQFNPPSPLNVMVPYNGIDCINTRKIFFVQYKMMKRLPKLFNHFKRIKMPAIRVFEKIELNGIPLSMKALQEAEIKYSALIQQTIDKLAKLIPKKYKLPTRIYKKPPVKDNVEKLINKQPCLPSFFKAKVYEQDGVYHVPLPFNWNSPQQLQKLLFGAKSEGCLGLKPPKIRESTTKTGGVSTGEDVLVHLRGEHEIVDVLLDYREKSKILSTYIYAWQEKQIGGKLFPTFKLHGTVTGRVACENPNAQQVPRDKEIRSIIEAPPGKVIVEADFSQIELRVVAHFSQDPTMLDIYRNNGDIHTKTATEVVGGEANKENRQRAKAINFGFVYGMYYKTFKQYAKKSYSVDMTEQEAKLYQERYFSTYYDLPEWHRKQKQTALENGYVESPSGVIRRLPDIYSSDEGIRSGAERQALNSPVQNFASELTLLSTILLDKDMSKKYTQYNAEIILLVHDSMMSIVDEDKALEWAKIVKHQMENLPIKEYFGVELSVPIKADVKIGKSWGTLKEVEL